MAHGTSGRPWLKAAQVRKLTGLSRRQVARIFPQLVSFGAKRLDGVHWAIPNRPEVKRILKGYNRKQLFRIKYPTSAYAEKNFWSAANGLLRFQRAIKRMPWLRDETNPYAIQIYRQVEVTLEEFGRIVMDKSKP